MNEEEKKAIEELKEEINKPLEVPEDKFDTFILYNIESAKTILNLIKKQQKELEKKDKIIDKIAERINQAYFDKENMYKWFEEEILPKDEFGLYEYKDLGTRKKLLKEYFTNLVEKE